jgi:O-antigen ligase
MAAAATWPRSRRLGWTAIGLEEAACVALFAFFAMQGAIPGIAPRQALEITGAAPTALMKVGGIASQAIANAAILLMLLRRPRLVLERVSVAPWAALLALWAVASTAWSIDPWLTARRALPFALAGLFGVYFAARFSPERQLAIVRATMVALALATIAVVVLVPSIGLDPSPGHAVDWRGVFTQKNACGRMMVLATAAVLFGNGERMGAGRAASLMLFGLVLAMSGSRGAWVVEAALLLAWAAMAMAHRAGGRARTAFALAAPLLTAGVAWGGWLLFPWMVRMLGRDPTLTGRTAIWGQVTQFIAQRPVSGYGYDAFWRGMQGPSFQVDAAVHFIVEHAHNGFLEILLELGAMGFGLFLLSWATGWVRLWPLWRSGEMKRVGFPLAMLILIALYDVDENTLLIYNGLFWVLYVAALTNIGMAIRDHRHIRQAAPHAILTAPRDVVRIPPNE